MILRLVYFVVTAGLCALTYLLPEALVLPCMILVVILAFCLYVTHKKQIEFEAATRKFNYERAFYNRVRKKTFSPSKVQRINSMSLHTPTKQSPKPTRKVSDISQRSHVDDSVSVPLNSSGGFITSFDSTPSFNDDATPSRDVEESSRRTYDASPSYDYSGSFSSSSSYDSGSSSYDSSSSSSSSSD